MRVRFGHVLFNNNKPRLSSRVRFKHTDNMAKAVNKTAHPFDKVRLEALLNRRFFYAPAFEIYGGTSRIVSESLISPNQLPPTGVAGLYDYGPPGSSLQANIIAEWRRHFIIQDHMLELDTTIMTPATVFETSGHVARFADWMVKDSKTGDVLRADHLVKNVLEARLAGDREARGLAGQPAKEDDKKKKKKVKSVAVQLAEEKVKEYERILAQVRSGWVVDIAVLCSDGVSWIIFRAQSSGNSVGSMTFGILIRTTRWENRSSSISCLRVASVLRDNTPGNVIRLHVVLFLM